MKYDLHVHSIYSDGRFSISELISYAKEKELSGLAITDHDSVSSFEEIDELKSEISIIKGIELSTLHNGSVVHILGYFKNNSSLSDEFKKTINDFSILRINRVKKIRDLLKLHYDIEIDYKDVLAKADGAVGRPHIAETIMEKYPVSRQEVFEKYIGNDNKAYVPTKELSTEDGINLLKKEGAIVIFAHPGLSKKVIKDVIELCIDGVEVYHPAHTKDEEKEYLSIAKSKNLIITGGSDFHEPPKSINNTDLGKRCLTGENLDIFLDKLKD